MRWLLALWLAVAPAWAQEPIIGSGVYASKSTAATYTGPGDVVASPVFCITLRACTAAIAAAGTQKIINVRNTSTSETCDIIVATNGGFGNVANCSGSSSGNSVTTFCSGGGGSCATTKAYDQSGNAHDVSQGTAVNQPPLTVPCNNSLPCLVFDGVHHLLTVGTFATVAQPWSYSVVAERTGRTTSFNEVVNTQGGTTTAGFSNSTNTALLYAGTVASAAANDNAWHAMQFVGNGASSIINVDNTVSTVNANTSGWAAASDLSIGQVNSFANPFAGNLDEVVGWSGGNTGTQQTNLCHNQFTYWGTSTSC